MGDERTHVSNSFSGVAQKIPDLLIKITFLGEGDTSMRLGIKFRFGIMGFSISDATLGLWSSL